MARPDYDALLEWLRDRFGDSLRWVASFDSDRFTYDVRHVREDLKTELTSLQLEYVIHRSMAIYNRRHLEDVYNHLGQAEALVVQHDEAMAVHVYFEGPKGVVVKLAKDAAVTTPDFTDDAMARLFPDGE
ncbi:hypothetical protein [Halosimplex amylolyticum]|uniref:hypothetical protein n=1 Tax=Halosimplex amylolyticum TaxID=3396616 RepID=UPI003F546AE9